MATKTIYSYRVTLYKADQPTNKQVEVNATTAGGASRAVRKGGLKGWKVLGVKRLAAVNPIRKRNSDGGRELEIFISSDRRLYNSQHLPIQKNLILKKAKGIYNHAKGVKLFKYLADNGAKAYAKEHGGPGDSWNQMFSVADRKEAAEILTKHFENEADLGNYDNYLPKKYQGWRLTNNPKIGSKLRPARIKLPSGKTVKGFVKKVGGKVKTFISSQTLTKNPSLRKRCANPGRYVVTPGETSHNSIAAAKKQAKKISSYGNYYARISDNRANKVVAIYRYGKDSEQKNKPKEKKKKSALSFFHGK